MRSILTRHTPAAVHPHPGPRPQGGGVFAGGPKGPICAVLLVLLVIPFILTACGEDNSPEEQIRQRIRQGELIAEARKGMELGGLVSDDYQDDHGRDAKDLRRTALGFIMRNKQIHLLARIRSVTMASPTEGTAIVLMGMLSQQTADQLPLPMIRADLYRFDLTFRNEDGDWNLVHSNWERAAPEDLLE